MAVLNFSNGQVRDTEKLPATSQAGLMVGGDKRERTVAIPARVKVLVAKAVAEAHGIKNVTDVTPEQMKEWRKANEAQVKAWTEKAEADYLAALDDGSYEGPGDRGDGSGVSGVDPVESELRRLAKDAAIAAIRAWNEKQGTELRFPRGKELLVLGDARFDADTLIQRQIDRNPGLAKQAAAIVAMRGKTVGAVEHAI